MSKENRLVFSYLLNKGSSKKLDWKDVRQWNPEQGILWVHLDYQNEDSQKWLLEDSGLSPVHCEALLEEETRPRIMTANNALLLILRGVNCNHGADPEDMVSVRMWLDESRIITMRHRQVKAIDDIRQLTDEGTGPASVSAFVIALADRLVDRMGDVISEIDDRADELEDLVLTEENHALRPVLAKLRRQTISLRRYIFPQRDVLNRLQHEPIAWLTEVDRGRLREVAERMARFVDDLDAARERTLITQEELNNRLAEQSNRTMYILSIVTAIFLPLGLITGLLGINVGGIPGTENKYAFLIVGILLFVFAFLQYLLFKRKKLI